MEDGLEELSCPAKEDAMEIPVSVRAAKLSDYAQLHPELELYGLSLGMRDGNEDWKKHTLTKQTHLMIESLSRWRGRQEWGAAVPGGRHLWDGGGGPGTPGPVVRVHPGPGVPGGGGLLAQRGYRWKVVSGNARDGGLVSWGTYRAGGHRSRHPALIVRPLPSGPRGPVGALARPAGVGLSEQAHSGNVWRFSEEERRGG